MRSSFIIVVFLIVWLCCQGCESFPSGGGPSSDKGVSVRLAELGIVLPEVARPVAAYTHVVESGNLIFVSGQLPIREGQVAFTGKLGQNVELAEAQEAARLCVINGLAAIKAQLGSLEEVSRIVRVEVFVNSSAGFTEQSQVANGASLLLQQIFGEAGRHARMAVGVAELPLGAVVEVSMIVEKK